MRVNEGEGFFHPVTHQWIPAGSFYEGAAHRNHENVPVEDKQEQKTGEETSVENPKGKKK